MDEKNVVGYVRLSRDDDKKNYSSIENQKSLIDRYAKENGMDISEFYEDDGVSGYIFDRPSFSALLDKLESGEIDVVIAKDLSRIGRNNAKVLLFLDHICQIGKRLIIIDDNYDTLKDNDDIIGIKSWFNERYVKDASKKIKTIIHMKQKEGTYLTHAPYAYKIDKKQFVIDEDQAEVIRKIFRLYLEGHGYRRIADILNSQHVPTPSTAMREALNAEGGRVKCQARILSRWNDYSVRDILKNDFYVGTYRLHKREKRVIHGTDHRVPKEKQYVFENHHEAIINKEDFEVVKRIMSERAKNDFRSNRIEGPVPPFSSTLFCKDCGSKLVLIRRKMKTTTREYYICSTYNTKGIRYCSKAHLINVEDIQEYFKTFLKACLPIWEDAIKEFRMDDYEKLKTKTRQQIKKLEQTEEQLSAQLKGLIKLKLNDLKNATNIEIIEETYNEMQHEITEKLSMCKAEKERLSEKLQDTIDERIEDTKVGIDFAKNITDNLSIRTVESLVSRIIVDENGIPEFQLKYNLNDYITFNIEDILNKEENKKIEAVFNLISQEEREYTSAKYLSKKMNELGYNTNKKSIMPYIKLALASSVLEETDDKLKPYTIIMDKSKIVECIQLLH